MGIEKITIDNFTVFKNVDIKFGSKVNVFIGENGTGKTHLLKLFYSFCKADNGYDFGTRMFGSNFIMELFRNFQTDAVLPNEKIIFKANGLEFCYEDYKELKGKIKETIPSVFIPAKDMLTHGGFEKDCLSRNYPFDETLIDILNKVGVSTLKELEPAMSKLRDTITQIIGGKVVYFNDSYYIDKDDIGNIPFSTEAEGFKRFGLLYRLIETGHLKKGSILLWDEPEANINPKLVPSLVEILLELSRCGVQIFVATHDYMLAKYFEVRQQKADEVLFHSLYKTGNNVECESHNNFRDLKNNPIIDAFDILIDEVLGKNLGD